MIRRLPADDAEAGLARRDDEGHVGALGRQAGELRAALAMLTRLPVASQSGVGTGARAFAIVGALVGLAGFVPLVGLGAAVPPASAILAVAAMAVLSGGIHLDGLADTADALVAVGPDAAERARKDPAVGAGGAATLILVLGLEVATLTLLVTGSGPLFAGVTCVVAGTASRTVPVALVRLARSRASAGGLGTWFAGRATTPDAAVALTTGLAVTIAGGLAIGAPALLVAGLVGGIGGVALGLGLVRARRQLDGDLLGASVELAFAATVLAAAALVGWPSV
ncbi:MAG: adenosylcobinamide-GDP ribazoletransferase [Candidatus Limnocylindrales bacterium]|nr:adenosylcobinamide-GDP ribazoletransferase [Candidatus Limnocylindrales bacterium]